ncbi:energy transducer TonB [Thiopseudomonas alkaliphila]|uniref:Energy transducer TonB n=1 Tax=Thiopseudomonas alkaliphila TaxID=1697053 RepID=A0AAW7DS24_9GAMM|nr:energy transducer TonB [Thiopseudomonas alkaliphila]MDM1696800.1 energy transducer TonB [Thiopseudomonas alkaliphila]
MEIPTSLTRSTERLGVTLFFAALAHVGVILGVGFTVGELSAQGTSLDITLSTFASEAEPDKADFLAQDNQLGSGDLEEKAAPKTTEIADFQENKVQPIYTESTPELSLTLQTEQPVLASHQLEKEQVVESLSVPQEHEKESLAELEQAQLNAEIASLKAALALEQQAYARRPRVSRQNTAATKRDITAQYRDEWRRKVELIGNLNYPQAARQQGVYGSLRLLVIVRKDGALQEMRILESSGQPILDRAALDIMRKAAPFSPFTRELASQFDQIEIIRTWRFEHGEKLSTQ